MFGKTWEPHFDNLAQVLERLAEPGLKLKPKKCSFLQKEVKFGGYIVSKGGVRTDPDKVKAVANMKKPSTFTEVRSFLGLSSYYRKLIKDYSKIAKPLFDLTKKDKVFKRDDLCETSFQELKTRLITAPVLAYPQAEGSEFILDTGY